MNKLIFATFLMIMSAAVFSQDTETDSYTIQRLIIYNQRGEILLEQHINGWMTPALRHNTKTSTNEGLAKLALEFGLKVSTPKLVGNFMFIPAYKPTSSFRQHYVCTLVEGDLTLPEGKLDAKWFAPHTAIEMMSLPDTKLIFAVRDMTEQILKYPHIIWGGTFALWKEDEITKYRTTENFYPIGEVD